MKKNERLVRLKELMEQSSQLSLDDIASELGVSVATIRSDMKSLQADQPATKTKDTPVEVKSTSTSTKKTKSKSKKSTGEPKIKFTDRLEGLIKQMKQSKDGTIRIPASQLLSAGFSKSAYVHAPYWRSYNNTGTKAARELGFTASLKIDDNDESAKGEKVLILTPSK